MKRFLIQIGIHGRRHEVRLLNLLNNLEVIEQ